MKTIIFIGLIVIVAYAGHEETGEVDADKARRAQDLLGAGHDTFMGMDQRQTGITKEEAASQPEATQKTDHADHATEGTKTNENLDANTKQGANKKSGQDANTEALI